MTTLVISPVPHAAPPPPDPSDEAFDRALVAAAFAMAAETGWRSVGVAGAARRAGLPLARARARFPVRAAILLRLGRQLDRAALEQFALAGDAAAAQPPRDRLFDLLMYRFDALLPHRDGLRALLRALPADPGGALLLAAATLGSMGWMLEAAGLRATGLRGAARAQGLLACWLQAARAFERDDSADLAGTMAVLDRALRRAERAARWLGDGDGDGDGPAADAATTAD